VWRGGGEAEEGERRRWRKGEGEEGEAREWEGRRGEEGEAREGARRRRDRQTDRQVVIYGGEEGKGGEGGYYGSQIVILSLFYINPAVFCSICS
jgi:hypothetical protein